MGYTTNFSFGALNGTPEQHSRMIDELSAGYDPFDGACKWYEWKADCERVSLKYPSVLFFIDGVGSENGDEWRCFVLNGKSEIHRAPEWIPPSRPRTLFEAE